MEHRLFAMPLAAACLGAVFQSASEAQSPAPRRADGRPDLEGVWDFLTLTPLERPSEAGDRAVLADEVAAAFTSPDGDVGAYNQFLTDAGTAAPGGARTSLIVDPPDGRLPPLAAGAIRQVGSYFMNIDGDRPVRYRGGGIGADGVEDRGLGERCLVGFNAGPPVIQGGYNQNLQILKTSERRLRARSPGSSP